MARALPNPMALIAPCLLLCIAAQAETLDVPAEFATIQDAIDASSDGDVIEIAAGTYNEFDLSPQQKAITLRGATDAEGRPATTIDSLLVAMERCSKWFVVEQSINRSRKGSCGDIDT